MQPMTIKLSTPGSSSRPEPPRCNTERQVTPETFSALITNLLTDDRRREQMSAAARTILPRHAADNVANEIERAAETS